MAEFVQSSLKDALCYTFKHAAEVWQLYHYYIHIWSLNYKVNTVIPPKSEHL